MKNSIFVLMILLLGTTAWAGVLRDNFNDGDADGWRKFGGKIFNSQFDESTRWSAETGKLVAKSRDARGFASVFGIGNRTWRNYEFKCQFEIKDSFPSAPSSPEVGFGLHYNKPNEDVLNGLNFIIIAKDHFHWTLGICQRFWEGFYLRIHGRNNRKLRENHLYRVRAVAEGDLYRMFLDDELVCEYENPPEFGTSLDSGAAVLLAKNCEVHFDEVVITGDDIPNADLNFGEWQLAVSPQAKLTYTWGRIKKF